METCRTCGFCQANNDLHPGCYVMPGCPVPVEQTRRACGHYYPDEEHIKNDVEEWTKAREQHQKERMERKQKLSTEIAQLRQDVGQLQAQINSLRQEDQRLQAELNNLRQAVVGYQETLELLRKVVGEAAGNQEFVFWLSAEAKNGLKLLQEG
jgi:septal ring factor EnvC (AmiA/AmiB activator)